ncbi:MAG TPA: HAMP domain-containing sensor histidine kinase [Methylophilus sp.]|nr:HAMP domain-containing sensor histidine kinase [Methylophilus sp.]HQQ32481.1 HAMP domain-containing sensor histidine kinase [Methylophilus sp.]
MLRWRYPKSFLKLLLVGFAVAVLPLLLAFINANIAFDRIARQGQETVDNAVVATRATRTLQAQLIVMERSLLQYQVLQEVGLMQNYQKASDQTSASLKQLLNLTPLQSKHLAIFNKTLTETNRWTTQPTIEHPSAPEISERFADLNDLAAKIMQDVNAQIDADSAALKQKAAQTQKRLLLQSLILAPLALICAAFITVMLARPISHMDEALERIGQGYYDKPIRIDGPGDLSKLGQRLDWLRKTLLEVDQQKQQFLRHVSHELKTPLTAIREGAELLHDGIGGPLSPQQNEIAKILRDNSQKLQKMIENLLNYTKLETLVTPLNIESVYMRPLIQQTLQDHSLSIQKKSLHIQTDITDELWEVDKEKVQMILDNLISNAIKFTPDFGNIAINAQLLGKNYVFSVADSGHGISLYDQNRLFSPFYSSSEAKQSLVEGSGLGLAICKNLAEAHGGSIQLETQTNHQGATFVVKLPIKNEVIRK